MTREASYLIVNADDFGYYRCVSRGIVEAHQRGLVTATGIFANGEGLERDLDLLAGVPSLDLGVHLNLTDGEPLTGPLRALMGRFRGKIAFARAFLGRRVGITDVETEWRAQIERCLGKGLGLSFLNSHEHVHMFPSLFRLLQRLAADYGVDHIRLPTPERPSTGSMSARLRDGVIGPLARTNARRLTARAPFFLGMGASGRLSEEYLLQLSSRLVPGRVYELMCHPGRTDGREVRRQDLIRYHDWEGELHALCSRRVRAALEERKVQVVGYRDLAGLGEAAGFRNRA